MLLKRSNCEILCKTDTNNHHTFRTSQKLIEMVQIRCKRASMARRAAETWSIDRPISSISSLMQNSAADNSDLPWQCVCCIRCWIKEEKVIKCFPWILLSAFQVNFCREGFSANRAKFMNKQCDWLLPFVRRPSRFLGKLTSSLLRFPSCFASISKRGQLSFEKQFDPVVSSKVLHSGWSRPILIELASLSGTSERWKKTNSVRWFSLGEQPNLTTSLKLGQEQHSWYSTMIIFICKFPG